MKRITKIEDEEMLEKAFSMQRIIIFKSSPYCGISRRALGELERFAVKTAEDIEIFLVDVIENRRLSGMIAQRTEVIHQSPQALYIVGGNTVWNASHYAITVEELGRATEKR